MIPKIIHYCWFGGNPLPESAKKCIASWRKFLPDYEIKEWNESNFDVNIIPYTAEAYKAKKYAFVSDYARFYILYKYGGLYFDTDVEVIRNMDDIIARGPFMGTEKNLLPSGRGDEFNFWINPGLGLGMSMKMDVLKDLLEIYQSKHFTINFNGESLQENIVTITTNYFIKKGLKNEFVIQHICDTYVYPFDYFCPKNPMNGKLEISSNSRSIHHYDATWIPNNQKDKHMYHKYVELQIHF